jgi:hypothetical protein
MAWPVFYWATATINSLTANVLRHSDWPIAAASVVSSRSFRKDLPLPNKVKEHVALCALRRSGLRIDKLCQGVVYNCQCHRRSTEVSEKRFGTDNTSRIGKVFRSKSDENEKQSGEREGGSHCQGLRAVRRGSTNIVRPVTSV